MVHAGRVPPKTSRWMQLWRRLITGRRHVPLNWAHAAGSPVVWAPLPPGTAGELQHTAQPSQSGSSQIAESRAAPQRRLAPRTSASALRSPRFRTQLTRCRTAARALPACKEAQRWFTTTSNMGTISCQRAARVSGCTGNTRGPRLLVHAAD